MCGVIQPALWTVDVYGCSHNTTADVFGCSHNTTADDNQTLSRWLSNDHVPILCQVVTLSHVPLTPALTPTSVCL